MMDTKPVIMQLFGRADGEPTIWDGQYLADFDFEAFDGLGEAKLTDKPGLAKQFPTAKDALEFYLTTPVCKPLREDGKPNRPLTATNWSFGPAPEVYEK